MDADAIIVKFLPLCFSIFFLLGPSLFGTLFKRQLQAQIKNLNVETKYVPFIVERSRKLARVESKCSAAITLVIVLLLHSDTSQREQAAAITIYIILLAFMIIRAIRDWDHQLALLLVLLVGYTVLAALYAVSFM